MSNEPSASLATHHASDESAMREALALSLQSTGLSDPNPRVGCVITAPDGRVLGRGFTQRAGEAHAEVMALRDAAARGENVRGATAYVTLEPCSHHGRTPPCCDALLAAGIGRVVAAVQDPNPLVAGSGAERLRAAGVAVQTGLLADEAREINIGFFSRMQRGRPWVRLKSAISLDGRTALPNGVSQWITSEPARIDGHAWRKRANAVLTGVGTVRDDDPRMDVRHVPTALQPMRVVIDSKLQTPPQARILQAPGRALVYGAVEDPHAAQALRARGAEVRVLPNPQGKVDLAATLTDLAREGINEVHVEAGEALSGSFVREGLVDEYLIYIAPRLLGDGRGLARLGPWSALADTVALRFHRVEPMGCDLRVLLRPASS
jgi:diaminohydroxyphosphoribosylaminopyrimidine deaminase/5-amino-6-(5-phosphoribosylamino)uracil reductase